MRFRLLFVYFCACLLGLGVPISLLLRIIEKIALDFTGFVQLRNPVDAGGWYYSFNAVMTHVACFVSAALYSAYSTGVTPATGSYSAVNPGANSTSANATATLAANGAVADNYARAHSTKIIDDITLFVTVITISAVWMFAFVGLLLTMKREYRGTFVSLQTGCAYARGFFMDNMGDDTRRIAIFFFNERQWRSIRGAVRQWVLGAYATWLLLSPSWLNDGLRRLIPDDFMPAPVVLQLDAQSPGGRRRTVENMSVLRRVSLALAENAAELSPPISAPAMLAEAYLGD